MYSQNQLLKIKNNSAPLCHHYAKGYCRYGNKCKFSHNKAPEMSKNMQFVQTSKSGTNKVEVTMVQKSSSGTNKKQLKKAAYFVVDTSASMSGDRASAAAEGMMRVKKSVLGDRDIVSLYTFDKDVTVRIQRKRSELVNDAKTKYTIEKAADYGKCTALYDAIEKALKDIPKDKKFVDQIKYVVVLTDGEDNHSSILHQSCKELIAKPGLANLYFVLIGVGLDPSTKKTMADLCSANHAHYIDSGASNTDIKKAFATVQKKMTEYAEIFLRVRQSGKVHPNGVYNQLAGMLANGAVHGMAPGPKNYNKKLLHAQDTRPRLRVLK